MTVLSALVAAAMVQPQAAPKKKVTLENGVVLYAERMEGVKSFTLQLSVSSLGHPEEPGQSGYRHLLEHLVAEGGDKGLGASLESQGMFLSAATHLDGIEFVIEGANEKVSVAVPLLADLLKFPNLTQDDVTREAAIIGEEAAVRTFSSRVYAGLVEAGYGFGDLMGAEADLAKATPEALKSVFMEMFSPPRMVVAVVGDIDQNKVVEQLTPIFASLTGPPRPAKATRELVSPLKEGFMKDAGGSGRAVAVGSLSHPDTMAVLAAAFALSFETPGSRVVYSPSPIGALVGISHPSRTGLDGMDGLIAGSAASLFRVGRVGIRFWAEMQDASPREKASYYAEMLSVEGFFRMEDFVRRSSEVSQADFTTALQKFYSRSCVRVGGVR